LIVSSRTRAAGSLGQITVFVMILLRFVAVLVRTNRRVLLRLRMRA
jgi:hypothetical protein